DILVPDGYANLEVGEKSLEHALPWDAARPLRIQRWFDPPPLRELQAKSRARVANSPYFNRLQATLRDREARRASGYVQLSLDRNLADRALNKAESDSLEVLQKLATGLKAEALPPSGNADAAS